MFRERISKVMTMGLMLAMLALLALWPVSAQEPSGLTGAAADEWEIVTNQLRASGYTVESAGSAAPAALPVTGASEAVLVGLGSPDQDDPLQVAASQLAASGIPFTEGSSEGAIPEILPVTGEGPYVPPFLGPQVSSESATSGGGVMEAIMSPVTPPPGELPVTGVQADPHLALMELYRQMYGGSPEPIQLPETGDEVPPFLGPQVPSTSDRGPDEVMGAIMGSVTSEPEALPVTGEEVDPHLQLMELYRQMYGGN